MVIKDKKVLLMGLGILGGGVATARWLVNNGAVLTITDMKGEEHLEPSLKKLEDLKDKIRFVLGKHEEKDFLESDIVVVNPDVSALNPLVVLAKEYGKQIENELTLFYKYSKNKTIVGITGTRGKTTTTNWINHILNFAGLRSLVLGNDPDKPLLSQIDLCDEKTIAVIEESSFALETECQFAPHIAVITNLYTDHLNRHKTMEEYALTKANIFKNQNEEDFIILNPKNDWTEFFKNLKPKSKILEPDESILENFDVQSFVKKYGEHNLSNFILAAQACLLLGVSQEQIIKSTNTLPGIKWRQELVFEDENLKIYNDTAATSPEGSVAAIRRFAINTDNLVLICGGTDRELEYKDWAEEVQKIVKPENLIMIGGSATEKMKKCLGWKVYNEFETLKDCFDCAVSKTKSKENSIIVFSPGAKSFEKFKNEFDRGEKFNKLIENLNM